MKKLIRKLTRWAWLPIIADLTRKSVHHEQEAKRLAALAERYHDALFVIGYGKAHMPTSVARKALRK